MPRCFAYTMLLFQNVSQNPESHVNRSYLVAVRYPISLEDSTVFSIVESPWYFNWLLDARNNGKWKDYVPYLEEMPNRMVKVKNNLITQVPSIHGVWDSFQFTVTIPLSGPNAIFFPDASYLGALFGAIFTDFWSKSKDVINQPHVSTYDKKFYELGSGLINLTRNNSPNTPEWREISTISFTTTTTNGYPNTVSISKLAVNDIGKSKTVYMNIREFMLRYKKSKLIVDYIQQELKEKFLSRNGLRISVEAILFSLLFQYKQSQVYELKSKILSSGSSSNPLPMISDDVWQGELFNLGSDNKTVSVTLNHSVFKEFAELDAEQDKLPENLPTGCRMCSHYIDRMFNRSNHTGFKVLFNPPGLSTFSPIPSLILSVNCIIQCFFYYIDQHGTPIEKIRFAGDPYVMHHSQEFIDVSDNMEYLAKLLNIMVVITLVIPRADDDEPPISMKTNNYTVNREAFYNNPGRREPLFLLIYPSLSYNECEEFPTHNNLQYHSIVLDNCEAGGRAYCKQCHTWLKGTSKHFKTCTKCLDCGKCFSNEKNNHYLVCRGNSSFLNQKRQTNISSSTNVPNRTLFLPNTKADKDQIVRNVWFADFECFVNPEGHHIPYLVVLIGLDGSLNDTTTYTFFGPNAVRDFIRKIMEPEIRGYLYFHNGSGYDFNLVLTGILEFGNIDQDKGINVLKRQNKILTAKIKTRPALELRDMYLFLSSSLARLCKDFKIPEDKAKLAFKVWEIKSFEDAEARKPELVKYCRNDGMY